MVSPKRVAIIGSGPCGMSILSAFRDAELKEQEIPEIVAFEKQDKIGGLWNYTWRTGLDEHGEYVHGSMYRSLWSNGPKECLELANYTFDEHFKKNIPAYPPRAVLQDYLLGRAKKYGIEKFVRFNTVVRNIEEKGEQFEVTSEALVTSEVTTEVFDYIVVATGHFSVPHVPTYPGIETFPGRILHSHDFRKATEFADQRIVLIGSSYSAEDIALQLYKYGAKECVISYRSNPMAYKWPEGIREVPQLVDINGDELSFKDGTKVKTDNIIFCTGYKHHFPFMQEKLRLRSNNIMFPDKLYKGVVYEGNKNVLYLGMQDQYYTFSMFDAQGWYARDYILGKLEVKDDESRKKEVAEWFKRGQELKNAHDEIEFQKDYVGDLLTYTDYPKHDFEAIANMLYRWKDEKAEDILTYRDKCYPSFMSGKSSAAMAIPWLKAKNVTLQWFLENCIVSD